MAVCPKCAIDTSRSFASAPRLANRINRFVAETVGAFADWNDARVTRKSLSKLSTRELDDIGLCAGDIDGIATRGIKR